MSLFATKSKCTGADKISRGYIIPFPALILIHFRDKVINFFEGCTLTSVL